MATKKRIYLAGPIGGCSDDECNEWRNYMRLQFHHLPEFEIFDPMTRDFRGVEGDFTQQIVEGDKEDIDRCDVLLVNAWKISPGTMMETMYAYMKGLRIVVLVPEGASVSPWIRYHANFVTSNYDNAVRFIMEECSGY